MKSTKIIEITLKQIIIAIIVIIAVITTYVQIKNINNTQDFEIAKIQDNAQEETQDSIKTEEEKSQIVSEQENILSARNLDETKVVSRSSMAERDANITEQEEVQTSNYKTIEEVTISKDMDLSIRTGLSKEDFKKLISNVGQDKTKFFYDNSDMIYDLCEEYQLNEIFFCGLISAESGWDIASNHRSTNNYISLMSNGKLLRYSSVEQGLRVAAQKLHEDYLSEGGSFYYGKTLSAVKTKFCPSSSTWVNLVYERMEQIINSK